MPRTKSPAQLSSASSADLEEDGVAAQQHGAGQVAQMALHRGRQHKGAAAAICTMILGNREMMLEKSSPLQSALSASACQQQSTQEPRQRCISAHLHRGTAGSGRPFPPRTGQTGRGLAPGAPVEHAAAPAVTQAAVPRPQLQIQLNAATQAGHGSSTPSAGPAGRTLRLTPAPSRCCCMSFSRRAPLPGSSCVRKDMAKPSHSERCTQREAGRRR